MLCDRDLVKDVLIKDFSYFESNDFRVNEKHDVLFAVSPFYTDGAAWKRHRNLFQSMFTSSKVIYLAQYGK